MNCPETHELTKQEISLGRGAELESSRVSELRRTALLRARPLGLSGDGTHFRVFSGQSFWFWVLSGGTGIAQLRQVPASRILRGGRTCVISFWIFLNFSSCWWLVSSVFLTKTWRRKITHANGDCGTWPGWVVAVRVPPWALSQTSGTKMSYIF